MIDLYTWTTPNGYKISIALEELDLPYRTHPINISEGEQFAPDFLKISPNHRIPAITDDDGPDGKPVSIFESGAILIYLADTTGRLLPAEGSDRYSVIQWLMFQMANIGPMFGQAGHFLRYAPEQIPYAVERYTNEVRRLCGVMDRRLGEAEFLAGAYSIADIACFPWIRPIERLGSGFEGFPNLARWNHAIAGRPAVRRGLKIPDPSLAPTSLTDKARDVLFGKTQHKRR